MKELSYLRSELAKQRTVRTAEIAEGTGILKFTVDRGQYDSLSSEVISILGRYDCHLYPKGDGEYWTVAP
jgi:hypothetical protein